MRVFSDNHIDNDKEQMPQVILPDVLEPNLLVVFCGTAVSTMSREKNAYYAGRGNRLWQILFEVGLTRKVLEPHEYASLLSYRFGLTDLVKHKAGEDIDLVKGDFDVRSFREKIALYRPTTVAFNGKTAASHVLGKKSPSYGLQTDAISDAAVFVLPSTSGAARKFWDSRFWHELAAFVHGDRAK